MPHFAGLYAEALIENGVPFAPVKIKEAGVNAYAVVYTDRTKTTQRPQPGIETDARGNLILYMDPGVYDLIRNIDGADQPPTPFLVVPDWADITAVTADVYPAVNMASQPNVITDGTTNTFTALQAAIDANAGKTLVFPSGVTFRGGGGARLAFNNVRVIADGAVFKDMHVTLGTDTTWRGGHFDQDTGTSANSIFQITGDRVKADDVTIRGSAGWTAVEVRDAAGGVRPEDVRITRFDVKGKSGYTIFGCREVTLVNCHAESTVNDDLYVLKDSLANGCEDVTLIGCTARGGNALLAIGSEVAENGYVRNVKVIGARGTEIAKILHIKPGGVDGVSGYNRGLVEDITAEDCQLHDRNGVRLQAPIDIQPGRGATVRRVRCRNLTVVARHATGAAAKTFVRLCPINGQSGINGATITDFQMDTCDFIDPYGGVVHNATTAPGHPAVDGITFGGSQSVGIIRDVFIRNVTVDGVLGGYAAIDGATFEGTFLFANPVMRNLRKDIGSRGAFHNLPYSRIIDPVYDATVPPGSLIVGTGFTDLQARGAGSPEGVVPAGTGSTWRRLDGGANTSWYVKESGSGNTGWAAK